MPHEFHTTRRIEFADTDMAGITHFSRFFVFMESAEHEFLRSLGTSVSTEWDGNIIGWPRRSVSCEYRQPAYFEDILDIQLTVVRKGNKSLTYHFAFTRDGVDIAKGQVVVVCCICNPGEQIRAIPIPDSTLNQIQEVPTLDNSHTLEMTRDE